MSLVKWSCRDVIFLPPSLIPGSESSLITFSPSPFPRNGFALSAAPNGDLYVFGGSVMSWHATTDFRNDLHLYSTAENTLTFLQTSGDIPSPRYQPVSSIIGNEFIVWGGKTTAGHDDGIYVLNLGSRLWKRIIIHGQSPAGRYGHAFATVGTTLFVFGGYTNRKYLNDLWALNLETLHTRPIWRLIHPFSNVRPTPRCNSVCVPHQNQIIILGSSGGEGESDVWSFDLHNREWSEMQCSSGFVPANPNSHAAAIVDGRIYTFGGYVGVQEHGELSAFDLAAHEWMGFENAPSPAIPSPRYSHAMATVGSKVFVLGGDTGSSSDDAKDVVYVFDTRDILNHKAIKESEILKEEANKGKMEDKKGELEKLVNELKALREVVRTFPCTVAGSGSNFCLQASLMNPETEIDVNFALNVKTNITIPDFQSDPEHNLIGIFQTVDQLTGFSGYTGSIGGGRFYLRSEQGLVVKGRVVGGPPQKGVTFGGSGTWSGA